MGGYISKWWSGRGGEETVDGHGPVETDTPLEPHPQADLTPVSAAL